MEIISIILGIVSIIKSKYYEKWILLENRKNKPKSIWKNATIIDNFILYEFVKFILFTESFHPTSNPSGYTHGD